MGRGEKSDKDFPELGNNLPEESENGVTPSLPSAYTLLRHSHCRHWSKCFKMNSQTYQNSGLCMLV